MNNPTKITLFIIAFLLNISLAIAHVPHDVVEDLIVSPNNSTEVYSIVRGNILKSTDKGITWTRLVNGLDNKTPFLSLTIDANNTQNLYVATVSDGIYTTTDAGASWYKMNQSLNTLNLTKLYIPDAKNANALFAIDAQNGLYKINRDDNSWLKVYNSTARITAISGLNFGENTAYTIVIGDNKGNLLSSNDAGNSWQTLYQFSNCGKINTISNSNNPLIANIFLVGTTSCGIFRSTDGGHSFSAVNSGIPDLYIRSIAMSPVYTVFASTASQAIFISNDGGLTWHKNSTDIAISAAGSTQAHKTNSPMFSDIKISADFEHDKTLFLGSFDGFFRSIDGGEQWQQMATLPLSLVQAIAISPSYAQDSSIAATTYNQGIYQSINSGNTWQRTAHNVEGRNYDIAFSPNFITDNTLFISSSHSSEDEIGKSTDRGLTWTSQKVLTKHVAPTIIAMSPSFINDTTVFVGSRHCRVYRSENGGKKFEVVFGKLNHKSYDGCISSIVVSTDYSHDNTVIAATIEGIYISHDRGHTWTLTITPNAFGIDKGTNVKLALSPNYAQDHHIFIATPQGLFFSNDEFKTVQNISGGLGYITQIAISPNYQNDKTLIITVKGKGAFKSEDGGLSFSLIATNNFELWDGFPAVSSSLIVFSPNYALDKTIFASDSSQVFRSQDTGQTWQIVNPSK